LAATGSPIRNALSFDVEEYFQVSNYAGAVPRSSWETIPSRLRVGMDAILSALRDAGVKATFFVLGWVAERHADLVRALAGEGHEIAAHGYDHRLVYDLGEGPFRDDLRKTLEILSPLAGAGGVAGYRAPSFSITERSLFAFRVLKDEGLRYDSSLFPVRHPRYGMPGAPRFIHVRDEGIVEFPLTTVRALGKNLPVAGGGYFRLLPYAITRDAIARVNREGEPAVLYLHPWEFDPEQPVVPGAGVLNRFRHRVNLDRTGARLRRLLSEFSFAPLRDVIAAKIGSGKT